MQSISQALYDSGLFVVCRTMYTPGRIDKKAVVSPYFAIIHYIPLSLIQGVRSSSVEPDPSFLSFRPRLSSLPPGAIADAVGGEWHPRRDPSQPPPDDAFDASGAVAGRDGAPRRKRRPRSVADTPTEGAPLPPLLPPQGKARQGGAGGNAGEEKGGGPDGI